MNKIAQIPAGQERVAQQIPITSFRGEESRITVVPVFQEGDPRNTDDPIGRPGDYSVVAILSRPLHVVIPETEIQWAEALRGDSHLAIAPPAYTPPGGPVTSIKIRTWGNDRFLVFNGYPNSKGYLGKLESEAFYAESFYDAEQKAYHPLIPMLSNWAVHLDIPLYVAQVETLERRTGSRTARVFTTPAESILAVKGQTLLKPGTEFAHYASLYREGLNSNSEVYRFLCFFKIIEGVRSRRGRLSAEAAQKGLLPNRILERFPEEAKDFQPWLDAIYHIRQWHQVALDQAIPPEVRGKKFNAIIDTKLAPLRNEIAHAILDSGELGVSSDDLLKLDKGKLWLPMTRTMVRRMLKNEFKDEFLSHLADPPAVQS